MTRHFDYRAVRRMFLAMSITLACAGAFAQVAPSVERLRPKDFPSRPIQIIVAYPAGGGMDLHARVLAKYLQKHTGQDFVVLNKVGAVGLIAHAFLAKQAAPDGYTVGVLHNNLWADSMLRSEGKWSLQDVEAIAFLNFDPLTWLVTTDGIYKDKSLKDVVADAKARPGLVKVGGAPGSSSGFLSDQVEEAAGVKFNKVPYQGGKPSQVDLVGNHIDVAYGFPSEYAGLLAAGKVRPIAAAGSRRVASMPNVPTFNEVLDTREIIQDAFRFVALPKGTPADRKAWLEAACNAALEDPEMLKEIEGLGATVDRGLNTGEKVAAEIARRAAMDRAYFVKRGLLK